MRVCGRSCETGEVITLTLEKGLITHIESGAENTDVGSADLWLSAGFFDLQVNGYNGRDFNAGIWNKDETRPDDLALLLDDLAQAGTALFCPTLITQSFDAIRRRLKVITDIVETSPRWARAVPGIHLEGPYLSAEEGPRGAHSKEHIRDPDWSEFQQFQEAAGGRIKLCTLAPEREGALPFIEKLVTSGVVVAIGHTAAEPETIKEAVNAGATLSTHLGNGAHSQMRRHPNYIWEQLAHDGLFASVIADGHHLPASVLKSFARVKGSERLILVSDAVSLGGLPPGIYSDGQHEVLPSGKIVLANTPYLAGAGHLLDTCIANMLQSSDFKLGQVTRCASAVPARILGTDSRKGRIEIGYDADLTLFRLRETEPLEIAATVCGGEIVYRSPNFL